MFFKLKQNFQNLFPQICLEYNQDVYGFNNDQAFPSMIRTPATIHINENIHSNNNYEDAEIASVHEQFYNYVPNADYDGGFFYGGLSAQASNGA